MQFKQTNQTRIGVLALALALMASMLFGAVAMAQTSVPLNPAHVGVTNPGFGTVGTCPTPPAGQEGWWGWHFVMPSNNNFTSLTVTFQNAGTFSANPFPSGVFVAHPDNSHAYIWTPTPDTLLGGSATSSGSNNFFNLSHICPGVAHEELTVTKSADTSYIRTHKWSIAKSIAPDTFYLYVDGSGDGSATYTIDVSYDGFTDSAFNVSGGIKIENTGALDAVITDVEDVLAGAPIVVACGVEFPYTLPVGETLTCSYSEDGYVEGENVVTVTTEKDSYSASAEIVWGNPSQEIDREVTVKDVSDLSGERKFGPLTAPHGDSFTYTEDFSYAVCSQDGCGKFTYKNIATLFGDDGKTLGEAEATVTVYIQCLIFQGETAWAANGNTPGSLRYTNRGNWATYVEYKNPPKTTTLFAGQTINVGSVTFSAPAAGNVTISVQLTGPWEFEAVSENLKVQDYAKAPSGNPAPGLFAHKKTCDTTHSACSIIVPQNNFYGVHVNVGKWTPDPAFPSAYVTVFASGSQNAKVFLPTVTR